MIGQYVKSKSCLFTEDVETTVGKPSDLLSKAASCLYRVFYLTKTNIGAKTTDPCCYEDALASLVFTKMEMNDPIGALEVCRIMFGGDKPTSSATTSQQYATCRLYAAEAHCILGDAKEALIVMFGSSDDLEEEKLKAGAKHSESPLRWLAQGFSIEGRKNSEKEEDTRQSVQVRRLLKNQYQLCQMLKKGDTGAAINIIRGADNSIDLPSWYYRAVQ
jgi:hypothetical protein